MTAVSGQVAVTGGRFDRLIKRDKVHGSLYTDPANFAEELSKIWYRSWVFVGHETEVNQPGDYVRKRLGPQDVIMTRDRDGQLIDSIDTPGAFWTELWAPVGLRYHALHHYFPGIPYHNLATAYRRLVQNLPATAEFHRSTSPSLPYSLRTLLSGRRIRLTE